MSYYRKCHLCGAALDPGERCDCLNLNVPVKPSRPGTYTLTEADKEYLKSFAIDGVIPIAAHMHAINVILNGTSTGDTTTSGPHAAACGADGVRPTRD